MKKSAKKTTKKKTKAVAVRAPERRLAWGGHMPKPTSQEQAQVAIFVNAVAKVYGVPSLGVNVMGNQPYLNKDGRLFLLHDLRKGKSALNHMKTDYLNMSTAPDIPSICKVTLIFKDGHTVEGVGEASKASVKLEAVKQTLNMMAETRATNRAIWKEIAGDVWNRVAVNLAQAELSPEEKIKAAEAGRVSYEEMQSPSESDEVVASTPAQLEDKLREYVMSCKTTGELLDIVEKLKGSKLYSEKFKKEINNVISRRVDEIDSAGK